MPPGQVQVIKTGTAMAQAFLDKYWGGGKILFVNNLSGQPAGDGSTPDYPLSLLGGTGGALKKLQNTTSRGHVIFLLGGHAENVSAADYFVDTGTANAFAVCGLGGRTTGPTLTWTAAAATWLVDTADVVIDSVNMFWAGPHVNGTAITVAKAMHVSAAGFQIRNCRIFCGFDVDQIITLGLLVASTDAVIEDNIIVGLVAAEITAAGTVIRLTGADRCIIRRNYISAANATVTDGVIETLTTASLDVVIEDNFINASKVTSTCGIDFGAAVACTGDIRRNLIKVGADGTAHTVAFTVSATANMTLMDNNFVSNNNERGLAVGVATT